MMGNVLMHEKKYNTGILLACFPVVFSQRELIFFCIFSCLAPLVGLYSPVKCRRVFVLNIKLNGD